MDYILWGRSLMVNSQKQFWKSIWKLFFAVLNQSVDQWTNQSFMYFQNKNWTKQGFQKWNIKNRIVNLIFVKNI